MNGYQKYKENSIYSMSGPELLLLLYEEAVKRLSKAEYALKDKEYALFEDCLDRTSRIVRYLISILDMQQPLSRDLRRIYDYLIFDISRIKAGREREKEEIARIRHIMSELRDAFEQASCKAGAEGMRMIQDTRILG
ncbi:MAG: flagellar protein FliS [Clostridiales bacterium]|nr:flagellar protein FliS [Clostridiales bacterium]